MVGLQEDNSTSWARGWQGKRFVVPKYWGFMDWELIFNSVQVKRWRFIWILPFQKSLANFWRWTWWMFPENSKQVLCMESRRFEWPLQKKEVELLIPRPWICMSSTLLILEFWLITSCSHNAEEIASHLDPEYCGPCYGSPSPADAKKAGCCNTCDEVREAYASVSWAFGRGEGVEQCEREHYSERLDSQRKEGCRIEGGLRVNKVIGNFHIAPGRSFTNGNLHVHDLENFFNTPVTGGHVFSHQIHSLRFGPELPEEVTKKLGSDSLVPWTNHHLNPLDNTEQITHQPAYNFMYFVKVVSTSYLPLGWEHNSNSAPHDASVDIGTYGHSQDGSIETHQYSVTSHRRSLKGGDDSAEGHKEKIHAYGGIPGVFFSYVSFPKLFNIE